MYVGRHLEDEILTKSGVFFFDSWAFPEMI
jgi:hypothetical protein